MRTPVLLAALLVASGILLSACGHSYRFIPAYAEQSGNSSVSQEAQKPATTDAHRPDAEASTRPSLATSGTDAAEGSNFNRNTAQVAETGRAPDRNAAIANRPERPLVHEARLNTPRGPSMNAVEIVEKRATASPTQAAPAPRGSAGVPKWFLIVLCIFLPPLAVALVYGISDKFWIDLLLTLCFWLPGVIYALIQVL